MIPLAIALAAKDLRLSAKNGSDIIQAVLLGFLLIFLFSLSRDTGEISTPLQGSTIFWLASLFCQSLIFTRLYNFEEDDGARLFLLLAATPIQAIWLGKALGGFILLLISQICFFPATVIFLNQTGADAFFLPCLTLLACDAGICALGSLLGALGHGHSGGNSLLSILLFPMLTPLLLAGINLGVSAFGDQPDNINVWLGLAFAFDAIFSGCSLLLFNFLYQE